MKKLYLVSLLALLCSVAGLKSQTVTFSKKNVSCFGGSNGEITMQVNGGSSVYMYYYYKVLQPSVIDSFGPTSLLNHTFLNLNADLYNAFVKDTVSGNVLDYNTLNITQPAVLNATVSSTNSNCFGASNGTITISSPSGGSGAYEYSINAGSSWQGTGGYTGLGPNTYTVLIRDANATSCVKTLNPGLVITEPGQLNANLASTNVTCYNRNDGTITISSPSGGSGSYQYTINGGISWQSGGSYTGLGPGTYNVQIRDAAAVTCSRILNNALVITQPAVLNVNDITIIKGLTCNEGSDGQLRAVVTGGTAPYSFDWYVHNGSTWVTINQFTQTATNLPQGWYEVRVNDANNCGSPTPASAREFFLEGATDSVPPVFYFDSASVVNTCQGQNNGSITIYAHGGKTPYSYSITTGGAGGYQPSNSFSGLAAGTYETWARDNKGCTKNGPSKTVAAEPNLPVSVSITANPSGSICPGTSVLFTASPVNGGTTPAYQWRLNGSPVGSNSPTYTTSTLVNGDQVNVVLTSSLRCTSGNPATSNTITASVLIPPAITVQPVSLTQCQGTNATFSVTATGSGLSYQWRKNGTPISGATNASYTINNITTADAGNYSVVVTGTCGTVTSNNASLNVQTPPVITGQPVAVTQCQGTNATFSVTVTGTVTGYQWRRNGVNIGGATGSTYTINGITPAHAGSYDVVVTGPCGTVTSNAAALTVQTAPVITAQPNPVTQCEGSNATFSVTATGTGLAYQWRRNGTNISGATNASYTITGITPAHAGNYDVVITGTCGTVTSNAVALIVQTAPVITGQPAPVTQCEGSNATFTVTATGTGLAYQWRRNGTNISGANSASYTINGITPAHAGNYDVVITGTCGNVTSNAAALTVQTPPVITGQPNPLTQCEGTNATFSVTASGTITGYQWRRNSVNISGATGSTYTINGITPAHAGSYDVVITGPCGTVTSNAATLTVQTPPVITGQPVAVTQCQGSNATFSVTATGTITGYQWRKNGTSIGGATNASYTINNIAPADAGSYDVVITGPCGTVTSNAAALTVQTPPVITGQPVAVTQCQGTNATFSVTASGTITGYQWRRNSVNIAGATSASYTINNITPASAGSYDVVITGPCGTVTSNAATLTVQTPPVISGQPVAVTQCQGSNATFSVTATGTITGYQWRKNGTSIGGATSASYTINNIAPADAGNYDVVITGPCGTVTSNAAALTVQTPPVITIQPVAVTQCEGTNATFTVTATGTITGYQWRRNSVNITGATNASYTINNITPASAGNYDVVITGPCGTVTSNAAVLTVQTAPVITLQPVAVTQCAGTNATFTVTASGTGLAYQWRKNGTNIGGATNASYTINNIAPADAGNYNVVITGTCGTVTSNTVALTVQTAPVITGQPVAVTQCEGTNATFTVTATGTGLAYQWRKNGTSIGGATNAGYTISNITPADAGNYDVVITGTCGNVTSNTVALTVQTAPVITGQPVAVTQCAGTNATFTVTATGTGLAYQWRKNGTNIGGATNASYTINNIAPADAGNYNVVITGTCGTVTSNTVALTVQTAPVITGQPVAVTRCEGSNATFTVTATGTGLAYQWRKNGTNIGGATNASYTISNITTADAGNYDVVITGTCGNITSNAAILTVQTAPVITGQPVAVTRCEGSNATFTVTATGTGLAYQWRKNGTNIGGATNASYTISNIAPADAGNYNVVITGTCGTVTSNTVALTVQTAPVITGQPAPVTQCEGTNATFTVTATGTGLAYQWRKNGTNIGGATNASYTISNITTADAGNYDVVITGTCGSVTSAAAGLTVAVKPVITTQPLGTEVCEGSDVSFSIAATGTDLTYQWRKNGTAITGQTATTLSLNAVNLSDGGNYDVIVYGRCDTIASNTAILTVDPATTIVSQDDDTLVCEGSTVEFSVTANGFGAIAYQWQRSYFGSWIDLTDDSDITGSMTRALTIQNIEAADSGYYRCFVSSGCGNAYSDSIKLGVNHIIATIGTPAPFLIDSATTIINVGVEVTGRFLLFDLGFSLVAPDGTEVLLKGPLSFPCVFNPFGNGVDVTFTTELDREDGDTISYCWPVKVITGTYAATGNWDVLHGKDPANGAWQIRVYDADKSVPDPDGFLRLTSLTFTDEDINGDTVTIQYHSGNINMEILNPISGELRPNSYILPIRLMTSCWDSDDARALVTVQGGIAPFTYEWTGPTTVPNSNDVMLGAGTYTVTVTDAMGCSTQATVEVSSPPPIVMDSFVVTDSLACNGDSDGIIRAKASGGTGYLTYTLLPGNIASSVADSGVFTGLPAGTYTLHIEDINDCFLDTTITIAEPAAFVIQSIQVDSLQCSGDADGVITVTAQGGKLPYTYRITPGTEINSDGIFNNLSQGNYVIRITDAGTCGDTLVTDTIRMDAPSPLVIDSVTVDPILCNGGRASITLYAAGGMQPYEGSLDGGANFSAGMTFSDLAAGDYTPAVRDGNGCTVIHPSIIAVVNPPVIAIDTLGITDVAGCYGDTTGSLYVEASGGWNRIEYSLDGTTYQSSGLFEPLTGGSRTLYIRDSLGCTLIIDTLEVRQPSQLTVSIAATHVIGSNPGSIRLTAGGGTPPYVYSIDDGATTQDTGFFDNLVPGLYYAFVQDANGCTFDDTVRIIINELNISITKNDVSCYGLGDGEFIVTALDGESPYWMTGSFLSPDTITDNIGFFGFIGIAAGSYDFVIGDAEGRIYADTVEILEPDRIDISGVITRPTCTTGTNDGAIVLTITGGSGGFTYSWSDGSTGKDLQGISEGLFSVTVTDANSCQGSADYDVVALHSLVADIGHDTTVCRGETLTIRGNVADYESISWEVAVAGGYQTYTSPELAVLIESTTRVTYTVEKDGCTATDFITIDRHPVYGINIIDPTNTFVFDTTLYLMAGQEASLEARADSAGFTAYSWSPSTGISDPASPSVTCMPENTTVYVVTGTTAEGCYETDTLKVVIAGIIQDIFTGFTPNGDGFNDKWVIPHAIEYGQKIEVQVFNRWGEKIFQSKGYGGANEWDGTFKGKPLPVGTYYFIITLDDGKTDPFTGTVTIIR